MMKSFFFGIVALMFAALVMHQDQAYAQNNGKDSKPDKPQEIDAWKQMDVNCTQNLHKQINMEFNAAIFYLQYAAYFSQYDVNLPGFAKFFFNAASEEREHGMKLMEYAVMRGQSPIHNSTEENKTEQNETQQNNNDFKLEYHQIKKDELEKVDKESADKNGKKEIFSTVGLNALRKALKKEQEVTQSIRTLIKACENEPDKYNDYHLVDYLTGEFLEEQHQGQRDLAGKIAMLEKMIITNPKLGEFIFDKQNM